MQSSQASTVSNFRCLHFLVILIFSSIFMLCFGANFFFLCLQFTFLLYTVLSKYLLGLVSIECIFTLLFHSTKHFWRIYFCPFDFFLPGWGTFLLYFAKCRFFFHHLKKSYQLKKSSSWYFPSV